MSLGEPRNGYLRGSESRSQNSQKGVTGSQKWNHQDAGGGPRAPQKHLAGFLEGNQAAALLTQKRERCLFQERSPER